jgi:hypothetical protein
VATSTTYTTFERLAGRGEEAVIVVKLMMAFNDLAVSNEGLSIFKERYATKQNNKDRGAAMYFIRLQASHLYEAMKVVDAIAVHERLRNVLAQCSGATRSAFDRLIALRSDEVQKRTFKQYVGRLRHNLTFHYDESGDLVRRAMAGRAKKPEGNPTSITRGTERYSWRLTIADDVVDTIVCRQIWNIPEEADLRTEADAAADYGHEIFVAFADFAAEFVTKYVRDGA